MIEQIKADVKQKFTDYPSRYLHTLGVVKTAVSLAVLYGVDTHKAYIAALFHDYTKYDSTEQQTKHLSSEVVQKYAHMPVMYHALSAAEVLKTKYHVVDTEILDAIRYHVRGRTGMTTLDKIILVADKTEPSRDYPIVNDLRKLSQVSLDETIKMYLTNLMQTKKGEKYNKQSLQEIINSIGE